MNIWVYPGSFDPVTNGHLDIIYRAAGLCDKLIVAVLVNHGKSPLFTAQERVGLLQQALTDCPGVEVDSFSGLLASYVKQKQARVIIKGLRPVSDFDYEFQMALLNKHQAPEVETVLMVSDIRYSYLSSSSVKELARYGGDIDGLVPVCVRDALMDRFAAGGRDQFEPPRNPD